MAKIKHKQQAQIRYLRGWGLSQTEIAKRMGVTQQAVAYQLKQFRRRFHSSNRSWYWRKVGGKGR